MRWRAVRRLTVALVDCHDHYPGADLLWGYREGALHFAAIADPGIGREVSSTEAAIHEAGIGV